MTISGDGSARGRWPARLLVGPVNLIADRIAGRIGNRINPRPPLRQQDGRLSRDYVVWAYRLILGREPENERVIEEKLAHISPRALLFDMLGSQEFRDHGGASLDQDEFRKALHTPKYVMTELADGSPFWVNLKDMYVSRAILLSGTWEVTETSFVRRSLKPGMHVVDVGANLGWFTVQMSRLVGEGGSVTSFEPRQDIYRYLCKTVTANGLSNVVAHNFALGAASSQSLIQWARSDENPGGTHLSNRAADDDGDLGIVVQKTDVRTLDEVLQGRVDFIKIDVEGAEKLVFDGATRILERDRPIILSEMAPESLAGVSGVLINDYFAYLANKGYEVFEIVSADKELRQITSWPYGSSRGLISVALVPSGQTATPSH